MKVSKIIMFNLLIFVLMINSWYLYFGGGIIEFSFTKEYLYRILPAFATFFLIFIATLMVNLSYIVEYSKSKKNLLRISLIILSIFFIISIIGRILEFTRESFCFICLINTIIYFILILINVSILKDLFKLLRKLFKTKVKIKK